MNFNAVHGTPFFNGTKGSVTAVATQNAVVGSIAYLTDLSAGTDLKGATVQIKDAVPGTIIWEAPVQASQTLVVSFNTPLKSTVNSTLTAVITGTSNCYVNFGGYIL